MKDNIHRINDIIKQVPDLRYDCSAGVFETDRRALYDFAVLIVRECADVAKTAEPDDGDDYKSGRTWAGIDILKHFGVE